MPMQRCEMRTYLGSTASPDRRWIGDGFPVRHSVGHEDCDADHSGQAYRRKTDRVSERANPRYALSDGESEIITLI